jgi:hypothetical protein
MGLDMYLSARKYVNKIDWKVLHDNHELSYNSPEAILPEFKSIVDTVGLSDLATDVQGTQVSVTCAYWRKSNQIHNWFVRNVQNNIDDCGEYYVSHEKLEELREICRLTLFEKNPIALAPVEGFFFGSTDIDQYYWEDIKRTIKMIDKITKHKEYSDLSFYYSSSW